MQKFRKKPVVVEAMQFIDLMSGVQIEEWSEGYAVIQRSSANPPRLLVATMEGNIYADLTDWIIKGVENEFYPCKDSVFKATYEPVKGKPQKGD